EALAGDGGRTTDDGRPTTDDGRRTTDDRQGDRRTTDNGQRTTDDRQRTTDNGQRTILADCATIDVSFISLRLALPALRRLIAPDAWVVALVKPQFEAGAAQVGKGGVVRDPAVHAAVLREVLTFAAGIGLPPHGLTRSPIT